MLQLVCLLVLFYHGQAMSVDHLRMMMSSSSSSSTTSSSTRVAVVTGASQGIGRGIAVELGSQGYIVYCLGRTSRRHEQEELASSISSTSFQTAPSRPVAPGLDVTVESAAEQVTARGGTGIGISCDLRKDGTIESILKQVYQDHGRLDVLVCSAYSTPSSERKVYEENFGDKAWTCGMPSMDLDCDKSMRPVEPQHPT